MKQEIVSERNVDALEANAGTPCPEVGSFQLAQEESKLRQRLSKGCKRNILSSFFINGYSAMLVFAFYLTSLESLFSIALSVGLTICKYQHRLFCTNFPRSSENLLLHFCRCVFKGGKLGS